MLVFLIAGEGRWIAVTLVFVLSTHPRPLRVAVLAGPLAADIKIALIVSFTLAEPDHLG